MTQPIIYPLSYRRYRLEADWHFKMILPSGTTKNYAIIPAGFIYDGVSSTPIGSLAGIDVDGEHRAAALEHDWLYVTKHFRQHRITRFEADWHFFKRLKEYNYPDWKRWAAYRMVRACGWTLWNI